MARTNIMAIAQFEEAIAWQAEHAEQAGAQSTARIVRALGPVRASDTALGRRMASWAGLTLKDALPLRVAGGLHHLALTGTDCRLVPVYDGSIVDQAGIDALVLAVVRDHDAALVPWLDGPPQTNEAGRSASLMAGLLWLATRISPRFELFEIGASAGINTMLERYSFTLGNTRVGPAGSPMRITPEWRGENSPPAPAEGFAIESISGCDIAPIALADPQEALRLKAYVWPDAPERLERIDAAIALARSAPPDIIECDAADFVNARLAEPQREGTARVMFHSIMWQYLPARAQDRIAALFAKAGERASQTRPLGWISLETDPATFRHELKVRYWDGRDGSGAPARLAHAHPHGAWVEWQAPD